jgi:putative heme-binding domain-containing protein
VFISTEKKLSGKNENMKKKLQRKASLWLTAFSLTSFLTQAVQSQSVKVPDELEWKMFANKDVAACAAALSAHPDGSIFVGIDKNGSLGKGQGKGWVMKFVDTDNDGKYDKKTKFAPLESVRGLIAVGNKVYALHSTWSGPKTYGTCYLSVVEDKDGDGVADGPFKPLITGISAPEFNNNRGVDHSTNGIRMGIDGWIYIAMGDFGIVGAEGTDGTKLTVLGGGVIRVRPDGSEMEEYIHGTRNICDVAIDPFMNVFTRGNTNDGGGWNIRFIHEIQSGEYGYPKLFKRYTDEILPALVDLGGGSGMGSMYFQEPGWPAKYNKVPLMGDWGRSQVYIHRLTPNGASFTQAQESYIKVGKMTDIDTDGSGRMFVSSWEGSGYSGGTGGYVVQITPKGWKYKPFPNLAKASVAQLVAYLQKESATWRFHASREIVNRKLNAGTELKQLIRNKKATLESRVAAIFTLKQLSGKAANDALYEATLSAEIREWALRALADRIPQNENLDIKPFLTALKGSSAPRVQVAAAVALGRIGNKKAAQDLIAAVDFSPKNLIEKAAPAVKEESKKAPAYTSKTIKGADLVKVDLNISKWKELNLAVLDGGNGNGNDHCGIFEPYLVKKDGSKVKLTDLKWAKETHGWGGTYINKDCRKKPLVAFSKKQKFSFGIGTHSVGSIRYKLPKGTYTRFQATIGHTSGGSGGISFAADPKPMKTAKKKRAPAIPEGEHAKPNKAVILSHIAVQALIKLQATEACLEAVGGTKSTGAYWAMRYMHNENMVKSLIAKLSGENDASTEQEVLKVLVRLYNTEIDYDGKWWWKTKPDTRGPYYFLTKWAGTAAIGTALKAYWSKADAAKKSHLAKLMIYDRVEIDGIDLSKYAGAKIVEEKEVSVDLSKIANKKGQIGKMSVEDIIIALNTVKGDKSKGESLFMTQGCIACHSYKKGQPAKGPFMGAVGGILSREDIAMSILRPNASISQGFHSYMVTMKNGAVHAGFITKELDGVVTLRTIAGQISKLKASEIKSRTDMKTSMMPPGLASGMSVNDFVSLVDWLKSQK